MSSAPMNVRTLASLFCAAPTHRPPVGTGKANSPSGRGCCAKAPMSDNSASRFAPSALVPAGEGMEANYRQPLCSDIHSSAQNTDFQ